MSDDPNLNPSSDQTQATKPKRESKLDQELKKLTSRKFRIQNDAINELGKIKDPLAKSKLIEIAESKTWDTWGNQTDRFRAESTFDEIFPKTA